MNPAFFYATAAIALCSSMANAQTAPGNPPTPVADWEAAGTDIPVDPAWHFGTLPNGLRYAVRRSIQPQSAISIRVRIGVGGLMEADDQQGWSHLLEHMTFRGTAHYADGEGIRLWQRLGASFGSDTNAQTTLTATTYQLDLPKADPASYREAMTVLADMMDSASLKQDLLTTERSVVEAELAQRQSPLSRRIKAAQQPFFYSGTRAAVRDVIGTNETLAKADSNKLKSYYEAWYRPDNATVVVAGDADPAVLEAEVKLAFGGWKREAKAPGAPDWGAPATPISPIALVVDPQAPDTLALDFISPHPDRRMDAARQQQQFAELVAIGILNQRLVTAARKDEAIVNAGAQRIEQRHIEDQLIIPIQPKAGAWAKALDQVYGVLNATATRPPAQAEIDQQSDVIAARFHQQAASAQTETSPNVANGVMADVEQADVTAAPSYYVRLFDAQRKALTPSSVQATIRQLLAPSPRLLFLSSKPVEGGPAAISAALASAEKVAGAATEQLRSVSLDQLILKGAPATVVGSSPITELDAERVWFSNGVELVFKHTVFEKDRIRIRVSVGGGLLGQSFGDPGLWWTAPVLPAAGIGPFTADELARLVAGRQISLAVQPALDGLALSSITNAADMKDALKLAAGEIGQPRFDATSISRIRQTIDANYASVFTQPLATFSVLGTPILHGSDARFEGLPSRQAVAALTPSTFYRFWTEMLLQGPVRITIVGDVDRAQAVDAVARTLGTLPVRQDVLPVRPGTPLTASTQPVVLHHQGDQAQAALIRAFATPGYGDDLKTTDALDVAAAIVQARLIEGFREKEGGSYTPIAAYQQSPQLPHYGVFLTGAQIQTARVDGFQQSLDTVLADLAVKGPTADEFHRAQTTLVSARKRSREDNNWWLGALSGELTLARVKNTSTAISRIGAVDAETVKIVAAKYLRAPNSLTIEVFPAKGAMTK